MTEPKKDKFKIEITYYGGFKEVREFDDDGDAYRWRHKMEQMPSVEKGVFIK